MSENTEKKDEQKSSGGEGLGLLGALVGMLLHIPEGWRGFLGTLIILAGLSTLVVPLASVLGINIGDIQERQSANDFNIKVKEIESTQQAKSKDSELIQKTIDSQAQMITQSNLRLGSLEEENAMLRHEIERLKLIMSAMGEKCGIDPAKLSAMVTPTPSPLRAPMSMMLTVTSTPIPTPTKEN